MLVIVTGGASSGKSEIAENFAVKLGGKMVYIATMFPFGTDGELRVKRHRKLRQGKGFETIEKYTRLCEINLDGYDTILLECISNLLANEMFAEGGAGDDSVTCISSDILKAVAVTENTIIVTNEVFSDGIKYDEQTEIYVERLGLLNRFLAKNADVVIESVCGIPVCLKGSLI
jgi:adenosylcobinamide kinase/adenosylcobinamide-phosphate guanylyltransferase